MNINHPAVDNQGIRATARFGLLLGHRFVILLIMLSTLLLVLPLLRSLLPHLEGSLRGPLTGLVFTTVLMAAVYAVSRTRRTVVGAVMLLLAGVLVDARRVVS